MPGVHLVGILDLNDERAQEIAERARHGGARRSDVAAGRSRRRRCGATPNRTWPWRSPFSRPGSAVLVEKPLARSLAEADALLGAARARGATLAVGHTERFNPALEAARPLLTAPRFIEVHRLGTFPDRSLDIDVVFDLMIHDLDVVLSVVDSPVVASTRSACPCSRRASTSRTSACGLTTGCIANLTASRISRDRTRKIRFFQPDSYVAVDFAAQELEVWRLVRPPAGVPSIEGGPVAVERAEPLARELEDFLAAVRERRDAAVTGEAGRHALGSCAAHHRSDGVGAVVTGVFLGQHDDWESFD